MSWKPAVDPEEEKIAHAEYIRESFGKNTFDKMDAVDRRDKLGHIKSFGGFGESPFFKKLKE